MILNISLRSFVIISDFLKFVNNLVTKKVFNENNELNVCRRKYDVN